MEKRIELLNDCLETLKSTNRLLKHCISTGFDFTKIPLSEISKSDHILSKKMKTLSKQTTLKRR